MCRHFSQGRDEERAASVVAVCVLVLYAEQQQVCQGRSKMCDTRRNDSLHVTGTGVKIYSLLISFTNKQSQYMQAGEQGVPLWASPRSKDGACPK